MTKYNIFPRRTNIHLYNFSHSVKKQLQLINIILPDTDSFFFVFWINVNLKRGKGGKINVIRYNVQENIIWMKCFFEKEGQFIYIFFQIWQITSWSHQKVIHFWKEIIKRSSLVNILYTVWFWTTFENQTNF